MSFSILGLGTALPPTCLSQADLATVAQVVCARTPQQANLLPVLYRLTGIDTRHTVFQHEVVRDVLDGTSTSKSMFLPAGEKDQGPSTGQRMTCYSREAGKLAVLAARQALDVSQRKPQEITHVITVSCTGFAAPGVDWELIQALHLDPTIARTHIGFMGCHGAFNGLRVARAFTTENPKACVLLCAVELCSLHYHYGWDPEKMVGNALFADGAAAVVGGSAEKTAADGWQLVASGSCLFPESQDDMTWTIGDYGFEMRLSKRVPKLLAQHLGTWLKDWLMEQGLTLKGIASWAVHPGGPRILTAFEEALGLDGEATQVSREVLAAYGNLSSPTVLFLLDLLRKRQAARPCVALGFGPGLVAEAMLWR